MVTGSWPLMDQEDSEADRLARRALDVARRYGTLLPPTKDPQDGKKKNPDYKAGKNVLYIGSARSMSL